MVDDELNRIEDGCVLPNSTSCRLGQSTDPSKALSGLQACSYAAALKSELLRATWNSGNCRSQRETNFSLGSSTSGFDEIPEAAAKAAESGGLRDPFHNDWHFWL